MRQTLKRFIRLTAGYSPVTLLGPLFTILLTPLYTRVLEPSDYGVVDVSLTLFALITAFVMLGTDQALSIYFFKGDSEYQANLVSTAIVFTVAMGLVIGAIVALAAAPIAQVLFKDTARRFIIYLLVINMVTSTIYSLISTGLRLKMGVKHVNALGLTYLFMTAASNILFVLVLRLKATGIIATVTVTNLVSCAVGLLIARRSLRGRFTRHLLVPLLKSGLGLLPGAISTFLLMSADRILLTQFVSQNDIGLYSIANKLGSMMYVLLNAAWSAWWPMALQMADQPDAPRQYARMFDYFLAGTMILSLIIGFFAPEILSVFTRTAYVHAAPYTMALLIYFGPVSCAISSFQIGLYACKQTHWISTLVIISALVNIALNLALNPVIGVWGAVWATVIAGTMLAVLTFFVSRRVQPFPMHITRTILLAGIYLTLVGLFLGMPGMNTLLYKIIAVLVLLMAMLLTGIITPSQLQVGLQSARYRLSQLKQSRSKA
jgi:O-antigen/teichoic acid export membrane protein